MAKNTRRAGRSAPPARRYDNAYAKRRAPAADLDTEEAGESADEEQAEEVAEAKSDQQAAEQSIDEVLEDCDEPWEISDIRDEYEAGFAKDRDNQDQGYTDLKFVASDETVHWDPDAWTQRNDEGRPALIVNQCPQFVRQVTGDIRQMRPAVKVMPVDDQASQEMAAKELPALIRYVERRSDAAGIYFQACDQQVGAGIGHWMVTHEFASSRTFQQEIRIAPIADGLAVVWDPDAILGDRSDADYCFVPWDMSQRAFKGKYPGKNSAPFTTTGNATFNSWATDDYVRVAIYFRKRRCKLLIAIAKDGKTYDVTDDPEQAAVLQAQGAEIKPRQGHKVYRLVVSAHEILEKAECWPGPDIPVVPVIGEEITIGRQVVRRGVIRVLRDVQRIYNYAISTQTEIVALQPKTPFIGTRKQFEKYLEQWETANTRNWPFLEYTPDGTAPPPQRAKTAEASPGLNELTLQTTNAMYATTGIYPSALGAKSNETSGKAIMARQREGDTGTYVYIDGFGRAVRRSGQIVLNMAPNIYDTQRRLQIAGEDGKPDQIHLNVAQVGQDGMTPITLNDLSVGAYEVTVEMGPSFSTKREESREGMTQMLQALGPQAGAMFIDLFVKAQDWPLADKIADRARMMLPPNIRAKEDAEAGIQTPPEPPPTPTPEQIQQQKDEQAAMLDRQEAEANANRKHELDKMQIQLKQSEIELKMKELDQRGAELVQKHHELTLNHESTMAQHATTALEASADPRIDQLTALVEQLTKSIEDLTSTVETLQGEVEQTANDHQTFMAEQNAKPDHTETLLDMVKNLTPQQPPAAAAPAPGAPQPGV